MAKKEVQIEIQAKVEAAAAAQTLGAMRRSLVDILEAQSQIGDESSAEFGKLQAAAQETTQRMAAMRDSIGDVGDKIRTLEGTPVERLKGSFDLLREGIMNLDFDKLKIGADGFMNALTPVKDGKLVSGFAGMSGALSNLGGMVKNVGTTFTNLGRSLLTNPIFLLAAAVAAIVAVLLILLNKLGLLKPIMDAIGKATEFVVNAFNALTDAMGLTSIAAEKEAEAVKQAEEKKAKAREKGVEASKKSAEIEKEFQYEQLETIENLKDREIARAELDAKWRKRDLDDRLGDLKKGLEDAEKNGTLSIEMKNAYNSAVDYTNKQYKLADEKAKRDIEKINKEHNDKIAADNKAADDKRKAREKERLDNLQKDYKSIIDADNELINKTEKGSIERVNAVKKAQENELNYVKIHYKDLGINLEDFQKKQAEALQKEVDEYNKAQEKKRLAHEVVLSDIKVLEAQAALDKATTDEEKLEKSKELMAAEIEAINAKLAEQLNNESLSEDEKKLMKLEAAAEIAATEKSYADQKQQRDEEMKEKEKERLAELQAIRDEYNITREENEIARIQRELERENLSNEERKRLLEELTNHEIALIQEKERQAIAALDAELLRRQDLAIDEEQRRIIQEWYAAEKKKIEDESIEQEKQKRTEATEHFKEKKNEELDAAIQTARQILNFTQQMSDLGFSIFRNTRRRETNETKEQTKKRLEEEDRAARIQFNINKGLQIGQAVINGVQSILAITSAGYEPFSTAIRIAAQVALNAASIAKIATQQYTPAGAGGGGDTSTNVPPPPVAAAPQVAAPAPEIPNFQAAQFFGLGQQTGGVLAPGGPQRVFVTETDITQVQNRVRVIEDRSVID